MTIIPVPLPFELNGMDVRLTPPSFNEQDIAALLFKTYGLRGDLTALAGERDQNFRVRANEGHSFVLKVSGPQESANAVDFQIRALEHIRQTNPEIGVPQVLSTKNGKLRCTMTGTGGVSHHVRLLTYVPGVPLDSAANLPDDAIRAVGALMGALVRALEGVSPPVKPQFLPWDVMNGLIVTDGFSDRYLPPSLRDLCIPFLSHFAAQTLPQLHALPAQVIHNDLHAGNVLCAPGDPTTLTGCIDFGDMVFRPTLIELSSSLGEFAGVAPDFVTCCRAMLGGFRTQAPLSDALLPLLYDATLARAVLCAQLAMFRRTHANLDPAIEAVHLPSAIHAVRVISSIDRNSFVAALSGAA